MQTERNNSFMSIGMASMEIKRLDIDTLLSIATQFRDNIQIIGWEKWGSPQNAFMPFEKLRNNAEIWLDENIPKIPALQFDELAGNAGKWLEKNVPQILRFPVGFKCYDVRWMPSCSVIRDNGEMVAYIIYTENYATTWSPALVTTNESHDLMIWDSKRGWAKLCIGLSFDSVGPQDKVKGAFMSLIQAWVDW